MTYTDSTKAALVVSSIGAAFLSFGAILYAILGAPIISLPLWIGGVVFFFILLFGVTKTVVDRFIHARIRIIYKTIRDRKLAGRNSRLERSINTVDKEVRDWSEENKREFEKMQMLENFRREYIGNVSHELKTPIFNIQGYVLTLLDGAVNEPKINMDYLMRTEKSVNRLIAIIKDLEIINMLESPDFKLNRSDFDLTSLISEVLEAAEIKAAKYGTQLLFSFEEGKTVLVNADRDRIEQVLTNLIDNSIKYGLREHGTTRVMLSAIDDEVVVEVSDNGQGIAKEDLYRVFERFYRADKARSRATGGTGLGLSIVKHIIEAHGQSVSVRSTIGVGSTFLFTLPKSN